MKLADAKGALVGAAFLGIAILGGFALLADWHVDRAYRHVVVEAFNINDVARISVNCQRAETVEASPGKERVDLGWLDPDDRVSISTYNESGDAAWGYRILISGHAKPAFEGSRGQADAAGFPADEFSVVMAKSFTAGGDPLGTVGCDQALEADGLPGYVKLPDDTDVQTVDGVRELWQPRTSPFAAIEAAATLALPLMALAGFIAAASTAGVRRLIRAHWQVSLAIAIVGLLFNFLQSYGLDGLLLFVEGGGVVLLLFSALVSVCPHTASRCQSDSSKPAPTNRP